MDVNATKQTQPNAMHLALMHRFTNGEQVTSLSATYHVSQTGHKLLRAVHNAVTADYV